MSVGKKLTVAILFLSFQGAVAGAAPTKEELYSLFNQANEAFRQANSITDDPGRVKELYGKAVMTYEKIVNEGAIRNAKLYYNLANAYLLSEDVGRAILNYRKAQGLGGSDVNIQKNLAFARSRRVDKVEMGAERRILQTLFFWHYDVALRTRFFLICIFFAVLCVSLIAMIWFGRSGPATAGAILSGALVLLLIGSVGVETGQRARVACGVITAGEVVARQGDGQNYPASFKDPLHAGTEFDLLERRPGWLHIKLADGSDGWVPDTATGLI